MEWETQKSEAGYKKDLDLYWRKTFIYLLIW